MDTVYKDYYHIHNKYFKYYNNWEDILLRTIIEIQIKIIKMRILKNLLNRKNLFFFVKLLSNSIYYKNN